MKLSILSNELAWKCRYCESNFTADQLSFEELPYILGVTNKPSTSDKYINLKFSRCEECGLIQHDQEIGHDVYSEIHSHAIGSTWELHHKMFAEQISLLGLENISRVVEIGPSVSPVSRGLGKHFTNVTYIDAMSDPPFALRQNENYISGYFPYNIATTKNDLIIASHVLEHATNIRQFFGSMCSLLSENGHIAISVPHFEKWIGNCYWNAFSYEHITYPDIYTLNKLAEEFSLNLEVNVFLEHSLFAIFSVRENIQNRPKKFACEPIPNGSLQQWANNLNNTISRYEEQIGSRSEVLLTGASHLSQYVLGMSSRIRESCVGVLDNAKSKHGYRLYGFDAKVYSFDYLSAFKSPCVIVSNSPYSEEIKKQILRVNSNSVVIN